MRSSQKCDALIYSSTIVNYLINWISFSIRIYIWWGSYPPWIKTSWCIKERDKISYKRGCISWSCTGDFWAKISCHLSHDSCILSFSNGITSIMTFDSLNFYFKCSIIHHSRFRSLVAMRLLLKLKGNKINSLCYSILSSDRFVCVFSRNFAFILSSQVQSCKHNVTKE